MALGFHGGGRPQTYITKAVKELGLDTSHFLGLRTNCGIRHKSGTYLRFEQVLVYDRRGGSRESARVLRRAMLASGMTENCAECGCGPSWNSKPLRLQIDHKNGDPLDNRPGNPRFACPNCHSQTSTYGSRNAAYERSPRMKRPNMRKPQKTKIVWPTDTSLAEMIRNMPATKLAAHLGVSDRAIGKRCRRLGIEIRGRGQWTKEKRQRTPS